MHGKLRDERALADSLPTSPADSPPLGHCWKPPPLAGTFLLSPPVSFLVSSPLSHTLSSPPPSSPLCTLLPSLVMKETVLCSFCLEAWTFPFWGCALCNEDVNGKSGLIAFSVLSYFCDLLSFPRWKVKWTLLQMEAVSISVSFPYILHHPLLVLVWPQSSKLDFKNPRKSNSDELRVDYRNELERAVVGFNENLTCFVKSYFLSNGVKMIQS